MANVKLVDVKKVYPYVERKVKSKREAQQIEKKKTNLQITEDGVVAVQKFNLEIQDGEFVVLVGPSGCGKSTTLRMIAGLETITEGELFIGGQLVNNVEPKDRNIAMVFQSYALYPHMTVYKNMAYSLKIRKATFRNEKDPKKLRLYDATAASLGRVSDALNYISSDKTEIKECKKIIKKTKGNSLLIAATEKRIEDANEDLAKQALLLATAKAEAKSAKDAYGEYVRKAVLAAEETLNQKKASGVTGEALKPYLAALVDAKAPAVITRHLTKEEIDKKVKEAAQILDISDYLGRLPKNLSGGQRQRVAIGRAIVRNPKVLLMDEPLSNLDAKLRNQMRAELIKLREKIKATFVYVTHDQIEAMTLGDRIVVMKDGFIQQIGTPQEVFDHPRNLFVSSFIGTPQMNYFEAKLIKNQGRYSVKYGDLEVNLSDEKQTRLAALNVAEQSVTLGLRPDHLMIVNNSPLKEGGNPGGTGEGKTAQGSIVGKVEVSELMGTSYHLHLIVDGHDVIAIVPNAGGNANFVGRTLDFTFEGACAHVFSKETGKNLEFAD